MPKAEPVAAETESAVLKKEIEGIAEDYLLFNMKNYDIYCSPSVKIPNVLNEIGRLRKLLSVRWVKVRIVVLTWMNMIFITITCLFGTEKRKNCRGLSRRERKGDY